MDDVKSLLNCEIQFLTERINELVKDELNYKNLKHRLLKLKDYESKYVTAWEQLEPAVMKACNLYDDFLANCRINPLLVESTLKDIYHKFKQDGGNNDPSLWKIPPLFSEPRDNCPPILEYQTSMARNLSHIIFPSRYSYHVRTHMTVKRAEQHVRRLRAILSNELSLAKMRSQCIKEVETEINTILNSIEEYRVKISNARGRWQQSYDDYANIMRKYILRYAPDVKAHSLKDELNIPVIHSPLDLKQECDVIKDNDILHSILYEDGMSLQDNDVKTESET